MQKGKSRRRITITDEEDQSRFDLVIPVVEEKHLENDLEESVHRAVVEAGAHQEQLY